MVHDRKIVTGGVCLIFFAINFYDSPHMSYDMILLIHIYREAAKKLLFSNFQTPFQHVHYDNKPSNSDALVGSYE